MNRYKKTIALIFLIMILMMNDDDADDYNVMPLSLELMFGLGHETFGLVEITTFSFHLLFFPFVVY